MPPSSPAWRHGLVPLLPGSTENPCASGATETAGCNRQLPLWPAFQDEPGRLQLSLITLRANGRDWDQISPPEQRPRQALATQRHSVLTTSFIAVPAPEPPRRKYCFAIAWNIGSAASNNAASPPPATSGYLVQQQECCRIWRRRVPRRHFQRRACATRASLLERSCSFPAQRFLALLRPKLPQVPYKRFELLRRWSSRREPHRTNAPVQARSSQQCRHVQRRPLFGRDSCRKRIPGSRDPANVARSGSPCYPSR